MAEQAMQDFSNHRLQPLLTQRCPDQAEGHREVTGIGIRSWHHLCGFGSISFLLFFNCMWMYTWICILQTPFAFQYACKLMFPGSLPQYTAIKNGKTTWLLRQPEYVSCPSQTCLCSFDAIKLQEIGVSFHGPQEDCLCNDFSHFSLLPLISATRKFPCCGFELRNILSLQIVVSVYMYSKQAGKMATINVSQEQTMWNKRYVEPTPCSRTRKQDIFLLELRSLRMILSSAHHAYCINHRIAFLIICVEL